MCPGRLSKGLRVSGDSGSSEIYRMIRVSEKIIAVIGLCFCSRYAHSIRYLWNNQLKSFIMKRWLS